MAISPVVAQALLGQRAPDLVGQFEQGQQLQRDASERDRVAKAQTLQRQLVGSQFSAGSQLAELAGVDPQAALQTAQALGIPVDQPARLKNFAQVAQKAFGMAQTDPREALRLITGEKRRLNTSGIETPQMDKFILDFSQDPAASTADLGGLVDHFINIGVLEPTAADRLAAERATETFKTDEQIRLEKVKQTGREDLAAKKRAVEAGKLTMGSTEILADGTTIAVTSGGTIVRNPQGAIVKGQDAADAVTAARAVKIADQVEAAGDKKKATLTEELALKALIEAGVVNAKNAAAASVKAFDSLGKVRNNMVNLDVAIGAIDEGANTGAVQQYLPSIRTASVELKNVRNRLGLDVIGDVTFGALSKGELDLALNTAIPTGLDEIALRDWLVRKKNAQEVYSDYLHAAGVFLGTSGNTIADWQQKKEAEGQGRVSGTPEVTTQEQFNALPSGALYTEDGETFRKP